MQKLEVVRRSYSTPSRRGISSQYDKPVVFTALFPRELHERRKAGKSSDLFPTVRLLTSWQKQWHCARSYVELTAAGSVQAFHLIPCPAFRYSNY